MNFSASRICRDEVVVSMIRPGLLDEPGNRFSQDKGEYQDFRAGTCSV